jgi:hypothetical protein
MFTGEDELIDGKYKKESSTEADFNRIIEIKAREAKRTDQDG